MDGWKGARGRESAADYLGGWKERGEGEERAGCGPEGIRAESLRGEETTEAGGLESVLGSWPLPTPNYCPSATGSPGHRTVSGPFWWPALLRGSQPSRPDQGTPGLQYLRAVLRAGDPGGPKQMSTQGLEERPPPVMPQTLQGDTASAIGCEGLQGLSPVRPYSSGLQVTEGGTSCLRAKAPIKCSLVGVG